MANFATPFASTGPRRTPNADEKANGFPCGAADQTLFNGLIHRIEAELGDLITFAGLTPTDAQYNQVRLAVQALIASATGGGEPEDYLLLTQAAARLPIFPEILTGDGRINLSIPGGGVVRLPGGINFLHRGINQITTVQTDFNTVASRTYHLRWTPTGGFVMKNIGDNAYNPDALAETNAAFDSKYDDMLVARIVTNAGNVATITNLANKNKLVGEKSKTTHEVVSGGGSGGGRGPDTAPVQAVNWARTPYCLWQEYNCGGATAYLMDGPTNLFFEATRYTCRPQVVGWYSNNALNDQGTIDGTYRVRLEA